MRALARDEALKPHFVGALPKAIIEETVSEGETTVGEERKSEFQKGKRRTREVSRWRNEGLTVSIL